MRLWHPLQNNTVPITARPVVDASSLAGPSSSTRAELNLRAGLVMRKRSCAMSRPDLITRFMRKVHIDTVTGCWDWVGSLNKGHGRFWFVGSSTYAHRVSYEIFIGPIKEEVVHHVCRNRGCVNPFHLEQRSNKWNLLEGNGYYAVNARKTHCPEGHPYDQYGTQLGAVRSDGAEYATCGSLINGETAILIIRKIIYDSQRFWTSTP